MFAVDYEKDLYAVIDLTTKKSSSSFGGVTTKSSRGITPVQRKPSEQGSLVRFN